MTNSEIRSMIQSEILSFRYSKKTLTDKDFFEYRKSLLRLCRIDCLSVLCQEKINTATYGDIVRFVLDFIDHISPFVSKSFKKLRCSIAPNLNTSILFSPRLTEIALGCILRSFFANTSTVKISFFNTAAYIGISILGEGANLTGIDFACVKKSLFLHSGRIVCEAYRNHTKINLLFPVFPRFDPIRLVPCSTELCRLCRI